MIRRLILKNFRSHVSTDIEFGRLTFIVGKNDSGKTNILRALKAVLFSEDLSASNITNGQKEMEITVETDKGTIKRYRKGRSQGVVLSFPDGEETYNSFRGTESRVAEILGFSEVEISGEKENLNFSSIYDPPFIIGTTSASSISQKILTIVGLESLVSAGSSISKDMRNLLSSLKPLEEEEKNLAPLQDLDPDKLYSLYNEYKDLKGEIDQDQALLSRIKSSEKVFEAVEVLSSFQRPDFQTLNSMVEDLDGTISEGSFLFESLRKLERLTPFKDFDTRDIQEASREISITEDLENAVEIIQMLKRGEASLEEMSELLEKGRGEIQAINSEIGELVEKERSLEALASSSERKLRYALISAVVVLLLLFLYVLSVVNSG